MKECPKCGNKYTDDTLIFCLADGTSLENYSPEKETDNLSIPTLGFDKPSPNTTAKTERQIVVPTQTIRRKGVSSVWIYSTSGLLAIILSGALLFWLVSNDFYRKPVTNQNQSEKRSPLTGFSNSSTNSNSKPEEKITKTYRVTGVQSNDVLNMRPKPGNLKIIVGKIPPNGNGIEMVGGTRRVGKSLWVLISYKGKRGWVNSKFITPEK
jgi:hypothetical protein